ncbi:unnamed protein product, partial [Ectocarpus sp. 13 AM-2016]
LCLVRFHVSTGIFSFYAPPRCTWTPYETAAIYVSRVFPPRDLVLLANIPTPSVALQGRDPASGPPQAMNTARLQRTDVLVDEAKGGDNCCHITLGRDSQGSPIKLVDPR